MRNNFSGHTGEERFAPGAAALIAALVAALVAIAALALCICALYMLEPEIPTYKAQAADADANQTRTMAILRDGADTPLPAIHALDLLLIKPVTEIP